MKDSDAWKPLLFLIPISLCGLLNLIEWTPENSWLGFGIIVFLFALFVSFFKLQTSTDVQLQYWKPKITSAQIVKGRYLEMTVSASNLHHVGREFQLPSWGTVITQVRRNQEYLITVEAPFFPLSRADGVTQEARARWYLESIARANGVEL